MDIKLQTALIEIGKEAQAIKEMSGIPDIEAQLYLFKTAHQNGDLKAMRKAGRRLAALTTKFMIDKL